MHADVTEPTSHFLDRHEHEHTKCQHSAGDVVVSEHISDLAASRGNVPLGLADAPIQAVL